MWHISAEYKPESLRVIIPVGGEAKRLLPLTAEVSKACIRLLNRTLIEIPLYALAAQGVKNFIFGVKGYTNYKTIHDNFESGIGFSAKYGIAPPVHIKYQPNLPDYGSADSARINIDYYNIKSPILAVQGDNIFDIDLKDLLKFHQDKGAFMTIGLMPVADVTGYGVAAIRGDGKISGFIEKPSSEEAPSNLSNTGLYVLSPAVREVFDEPKVQQMIRVGHRLDFGYDLIPYLIETGRPVYGYPLRGAWYDVGTPERYLEAMSGILHGKLNSLRDFGGRVSKYSTVWIQGESVESLQRRTEIIQKVREGKIVLEGAVLIGRHCSISDGARIANSCIDNYTQVGRNVVVENSAVMDRVIVGDYAEIRNSIVGRHSTIDSNQESPTRIVGTSVVGDDVTLDAGCSLTAAKIYPHKHLHPRELLREILV